MSNDQSTQNQLVPDGGAYNVIAVSFEDDNNAYKALTVLNELNSEARISLQEGVVAERGDDGQVVEKDRTEPGSCPGRPAAVSSGCWLASSAAQLGC